MNNMTDKEFVISIYENAFCNTRKMTISMKNQHYPCYRIYKEKNQKVIGISFFTEELAWANAKDRINFKIINMLKG